MTQSRKRMKNPAVPVPTTIARLQKRLKNARQRALYWSGNPSFASNRHVPRRGRGKGVRDMDLEYELAIDDIEALTDRLESLDGKKRNPYDPKKEFRDAYARIMANTRPSRRSLF